MLHQMVHREQGGPLAKLKAAKRLEWPFGGKLGEIPGILAKF
jgi:hypothetical protein